MTWRACWMMMVAASLGAGCVADQLSADDGGGDFNPGSADQGEGGPGSGDQTPGRDPGAPGVNPDAPGANNDRADACDPGAAEICDDNFDNNCDGNVDEGCTCTVAQKPCYSGDPADLDAPRGACQAGSQSCDREFYTVCEGEILPTQEVCDGIDNDCDGEVDEGLGCDNAAPTPTCPSDQSGPPLANYDFLGQYDDPDGDPMASARWTIADKPLGSTSTLNPSEGLRAGLFADAQGTYILQLEVTDSRGGVGRCTTTLTTLTQDNLRIEMSWNLGQAGDSSDVDLHLLRDPRGLWFDDGIQGDDCYYLNCRVCDLPSSQEDACRAELADFNGGGQDIPGKVAWFPPIDDDDPRLDLDDVEGNGPENINIKRPRDGTYRLGVHYWDPDGFGDATVTVKIFCGGELARQFEPVVLRDTDTFGGPNTQFWEVADIVWAGNGCQINELGSQGNRQICTRREAEDGDCGR